MIRARGRRVAERRAAPLLAILAAGLLAAGAAGCRRKEAPPAPPPPASPRASAAPVDHALPGELAEGAEKAFGFPIPRRLRLAGRFDDAVFATGDVAPDLVANYVRQRVTAEHVETGPAATVFSRTTLKTDPSHVLRIDVTVRDGDTLLIVRDETRPPVREGLSEDERWKELGLSPGGAPRDPTHLQ
jgi:hypothetical protein